MQTKSELYVAIEKAALAEFGDLLSPELAQNAASALAAEATALVETMLHTNADALREHIEGQLATLAGGRGAKGPAKKKVPKKSLVKKVDGAAKPNGDENGELKKAKEARPA